MSADLIVETERLFEEDALPKPEEGDAELVLIKGPLVALAVPINHQNICGLLCSLVFQ